MLPRCIDPRSAAAQRHRHKCICGIGRGRIRLDCDRGRQDGHEAKRDQALRRRMLH
jgi:hypothetical protein